jgi:hypothetical protein
MKSSDLLRLERYLNFHLAIILEQLNGNPKARFKHSSVEFSRSIKLGTSTPVLKECLLRSSKIHSALARIQEGTYGICLGCEDESGLRCLEVVPWTQFCIACEKEFERYPIIGEPPHNQSLSPRIGANWIIKVDNQDREIHRRAPITISSDGESTQATEIDEEGGTQMNYTREKKALEQRGFQTKCARSCGTSG